ncbi:MAG: hypothetical protein AB1779_11855 [Candidatus Thermoplasmatota archaeon]
MREIKAVEMDKDAEDKNKNGITNPRNDDYEALNLKMIIAGKEDACMGT